MTATLADRTHAEPAIVTTKTGHGQRAVLPEELSEAEVAAITTAEVDSRHAHLNGEARDWRP